MERTDSMKINFFNKIAIIILTAIIFSCGAAFAAAASSKDSNSPAVKNKKSDSQGHADKFMQKLKEKLNLTDKQTAVLKPIITAEVKDIKAVRQNDSLSKEQKQSKISEIRDAANKKINAILTPEQQAKWTELKKNAEQRHQKRKHSGHKSKQKIPADSNS